MNKKITKVFIIILAWLALIYPLWVRIQTLQWDFNLNTWSLNLFPLFGLIAFILLWFHSLCGVFEDWLKEYIDFDWFVHVTSIIILICIIAHPLLLFIGMDFSISNIFFYYGARSLWFVIIAWLLLISYDVGKMLKKYNFFAKNWHNILAISNIGFLMTFFHSLILGSDLQSGPLKYIWIFYGTTAIMAITYTYGIKRFVIK